MKSLFGWEKGLYYIIFSLLACGLQGAEIKVDSSAPKGAGSLWEAVLAARDGDLILIRTEDPIVLTETITVAVDITIKGANGPLLHTISGGGAIPVFAIPPDSVVTLAGLTVENGSSSGNGGAIRSTGQLHLESVRLRGNHAAGLGGAVYQDGGSLSTDRSYFLDNRADTGGGAIAAVSANVYLGSTGLEANFSPGLGGAVLLQDSATEIYSSSLMENESGELGGAIAVAGGSVHALNLTLVDNLSPADPLSPTGRNIQVLSGTLAIGNSIIAGEDGYASLGGSGISSLGYNLSDGPLAPWHHDSDIGEAVSLGIGEKGTFGGLSPSYPVLPGSPAIDGGGDSHVPGRDQRGLTRVCDGDGTGGDRIDIGAFEIQLYVVSALQIRGSATGGADDGGFGNPFDPSDDADSISSADVFAKLTQTGKADIGDAVGANNAAGGGAVAFTQRIQPGRIFLKGSELEIRRNLAIYGPGADIMTIDGDGRSPVFRISDQASGFISGISIENGSSSSGGGLVVEGEANVELEAVSIRYNKAGQKGGGLSVESGSAYVFRSALLNNTAGTDGGALAAGPQTMVVVDNSTLALNSASGRGGAIFSKGSLDVVSSTLVSNNSQASGPAIYLDGPGTGNLVNSIFSQGTVSGLAEGTGAELSSLGSNISTGPESVLNLGSDRAETNPQLGALTLRNGTHSYAPEAPGPAIDTGDESVASELDQPGNIRVRGATIDIGSVEYQNDAPYLTSFPSSLYFRECLIGPSYTTSFTIAVMDDEGDPVTATWSVNGVPVAPPSVVAPPYDPFSSPPLTFNMGISQVSVVLSDGLISSGPFSFNVSLVADATPPAVTLAGEKSYTLECGQTYTELGASVSDYCDDTLELVVHESTLGDPIEPGGNTYDLGTGSYTITYKAVDDAGNVGYSEQRVITVEDTTNPSIWLKEPLSITLECGETFLDPGASASDTCDSDVTVTILEQDIFHNSVPAPGTYTITYQATDNSGNSATVTRQVLVLDTTPPQLTLNVPEGAELVDGDPVYRIDTLTDPGFCHATLEFSASAEDGCGGEIAPENIVFTILANSELPQDVVDIKSPFDFPPGNYVVQASVKDLSGNEATATFEVSVVDEYNNCEQNFSWPRAYDLELDPVTDQDGVLRFYESREFPQLLAFTDQARWYKFKVQPGSRVTVLLDNLASNYDLVLYGDIRERYEELKEQFKNPQTRDASLLGVEFAAESFSAESFSAESFSAEVFSAESFSAESFSAESFSAESFSAESFSAESFSAESFSAESFSAESFSPDMFTAESFSAESFSAESFSPEDYVAESFSAESFSAESFSAAQVSSVVGFSATPGLASEGIALNSYTRSGEFYVRVRGYNGTFNPEVPFTVTVYIEPEICDGLKDTGELGLPAFRSGTEDADVQPDRHTLVLWDSSRTDLTGVPLADMESLLAAFAARPEVRGQVIDLAGFERINALNAQADEKKFTTCPFAKNMVATEIKAIIDDWRANHLNLQYIVLLGSDDSIPFFRTPDEAFLANETNYVPPVKDSTHSQSSLRYGQILTQDPYGAACELNLVTGPFPYPQLAVGRLVETGAEIAFQIGNYLDTAEGLLPTPSTALVTGYDFLDDAARAVQYEFEEAINGPVDSLISDSALAPSECWSANDLATILLGSRHDLVFMAGHFSTGSALAADYETRLTAAQVEAFGPDFLNSLVFSIGCHSGYNTVDSAAINGITKQPDWAQAFARLGAIFIAGTGYQYGDTEFIEYSERLYLEFARQIRAGDGPVSLGEALVKAKRKYLAETPQMRGIHEKALLQTTLFGLPMIRIDMPGNRYPDSSLGTDDVIDAQLVSSVPGKDRGLATGDLDFFFDESNLFLNELTLKDVESDLGGGEPEYVTANWYSGIHGIVTSTVEPVLPLETHLVSADYVGGQPNTGHILRGVGFRGGEYSERLDYLPLTGAPTTEIRGVFANFFSPVYYPIQPWAVNQLGVVCGGTDGQSRLNLFPTQYQASGGGVVGGTLRVYDEMNFRLYYSDYTGILNEGTDNEIIPALAAPPSIAKVLSEEDELNDTVLFDITVLGDPSAGIQEVWITWTSPAVEDETGSRKGKFESVYLAQDPVDSTRWTGVLPLHGLPSQQVRFMVQAASGTGLVAMRTNNGQLFEVGLDELRPRNPTTVTLGTVPDQANYGDFKSLSATLTNENGPISDVRVGFRVGTAKVSGFTNSAGYVEVELPMLTRPDDYDLQAYYQGDRENAPSVATHPIRIDKQATELLFEPIPNEPYSSDIIVFLRALNGTPLKERTVFFLVDYGDFQIGNAVITDFSGRADLSEIELPAGDVTITAYFNGTIPVPGEELPVTIFDDLYEPAIAFVDNITMAEEPEPDSLAFEPQQVDVHYKETGKGKNLTEPLYENASIQGGVEFTVPLQPAQLLADGNYLINASVEAKLAGVVIASETVTLDTRGDNGNHWTTTRRPGQKVSYVGIHWKDAPRFDSALNYPNAPRIYSIFIGNSFSEVVYVPNPGTYYTVFPDGMILAVENGNLNLSRSSGLVEGDYNVEADGSISLVLGYGIKPGMHFTTWNYARPDNGKLFDVVVEEGNNYLLEGGRMIIRLAAVAGMERPASSDTPNRFEFKFKLGSGEGETQVTSSARIGEGPRSIPWSSEDPNHKQYRP